MTTHFINPTKTILTTLLILTLLTSFSKPKKQDPPVKKNNSSQVELNGRIVVNTKNVNGAYKLEVLYRDMVTNTFSVKNNQAVKMLLKKDSPYVIKISKKGYVPRYICINTSLYDKTNKNFYSFNLETDFIPVAEAMRLDDEALQLPIALISYNKKAGNFDNNKDYTLFVQQKLYSGVSEIFPNSIKD